MELAKERQKAAEKLLKSVNTALVVGAIVSLLLGFAVGVYLALYVVCLVICALTVAVRSRLGNLSLGPYALSLGISLTVVFGIALAGFYGPNTTAVNEFSAGSGTQVVDKGIGTAVWSSITLPDVFTAAALFGYHCSGPDCKVSPWLDGLLVDSAILTGGVVAGNLLAVRHLASSKGKQP